VYGTPSPANGSTGNLLSLTWSIPINDPEGNSFNWVIQCSNGQSANANGASNGTKSLSLSGLAYLTTYKVWVNATDPAGSGLYTRRWYTFTTKQLNNPPVFGAPSPANGSTGNLLSLSWGIPINDPEGNTFTWTIQCSNGQTNSGSGASNGTKSLSLSGLAYLTTYKVWVNATDPAGSGLYTRRWYTFTTKATPQAIMGITLSNNTVVVGVTFTATIYINPTVAVGGWEMFMFTYTQGLLNATLVSPGAFWIAFFDPGIINDANGTITGIQSFTTGPYYPDENHTACVIEFTALHTGSCEFNLSHVMIADSEFHPLDVTTLPAIVIITSPPVISNEYPMNTATIVARPPTQLSVQVNDSEAEPMVIFIRWKNHQGAWVTLQTYTDVGNGTYNFIPPTTNDWIWGNTTYTWSVNVTDGVSWTNETYRYTTGGSRYDVNNNNKVNFQDAGLVWTHRTSLVPYDGLYDVNGNGQVNFQDAGLTWVNRD
jgi:hypothetical protein